MFNLYDVVQFQTRDGRPEGLSGKGIITEVHPDHFIVANPYIIKTGPNKGEFIVRRIYVEESELSRPTCNTWGYYFRYKEGDFLGPYETKEEMERVKSEFKAWAVSMACVGYGQPATSTDSP